MGLKKKKLKVRWNGEEIEIVVRELLAGEVRDAEQKGLQINVVGNTPKATVNAMKIQLWKIAYAIDEAPFKPANGVITNDYIESIKKLSPASWDLILNTINELNYDTEEQQTFLDKNGNSETLTQ